MNIAITLETINERYSYEGNMYEQEHTIRSVGDRFLTSKEVLAKEIEKLQFHTSRFASEGATLRQINQYRVLMDYLDLLYEQENYYKCAKVATVIELFFGLDISFLRMLRELRAEIEERGPIYFETLVNTARRNVKNNPNRRGG